MSEDFSGGSVISYFAEKDRRQPLRKPTPPSKREVEAADILKATGLARVSYPTHAWVCGVHTGLPCDCGEPFGPDSPA